MTSAGRTWTRLGAWIGRCVHLESTDLLAYDETERDISNATLRRLVGPAGYAEVEAQFGFPHSPTLAKDWAVRYGRGLWKGTIPCVCVHHSEIHHLWQLLPDKRTADKPVPGDFS